MLALAATASGASLEIAVRHTFNGDPLLLDSLRYENAGRETLSVTRLSYLLSGFAVEREDGVWVELADRVAWMDAERRRTTVRLDDVPEGKYRALRFHLGPDAAANSANPAQRPAEHPLNPNLNGLHWTWQTGYIFLALEWHFRAGAAEPGGYSYHFARTPNRTRISLAGTDSGRFDVTQNEADRGKFATPALRNLARTAPYMHDGRFATLEEVVAHYSTGLHRSATLDPNLAKHPAGGVPLTAEEQRALVAFLKTLSDE